MKIITQIPNKETIISTGVPVKISQKGKSWSELVFDGKRKEKGVYVIHHNKKIKYIGKTNGKTMSFGTRLRRHFQESAAGKNNHTYSKLAALVTPPEIMVTLYNLNQICSLTSNNFKNMNLLKLIPLFEAALIFAMKPEFQKQQQLET